MRRSGRVERLGLGSEFHVRVKVELTGIACPTRSSLSTLGADSLDVGSSFRVTRMINENIKLFYDRHV